MCTYTDNTMGRLLGLKKAERTKRELGSKYKIKNIEEVEHILDIKVEKVKETISQKVYAI